MMGVVKRWTEHVARRYRGVDWKDLIRSRYPRS